MRKLKMRNKKFVEVFERYQKLVMKLVYDKSSDMELAKEICQHTFFNILSAHGQGKGRTDQAVVDHDCEKCNRR